LPSGAASELAALEGGSRVLGVEAVSCTAQQDTELRSCVPPVPL
jgi:hypothetical protein